MHAVDICMCAVCFGTVSPNDLDAKNTLENT